MYELKIYKRVLCKDIEEWCKIWRGIEVSVQNWHEEFDKFWREHSKISIICTLMGFFWTKYIMVELKYRGDLLDETKYWCNIWRKTELCFQKWNEEFSKFSLEHLKMWKLVFSWDPFAEIWKYMSLKFIEEL